MEYATLAQKCQVFVNRIGITLQVAGIKTISASRVILEFDNIVTAVQKANEGLLSVRRDPHFIKLMNEVIFAEVMSGPKGMYSKRMHLEKQEEGFVRDTRAGRFLTLVRQNPQPRIMGPHEEAPETIFLF